MDPPNSPKILIIATAIVALSVLTLILKARRGRDRRKRPPEASGGWPLIGHLHLLAVKVPPFRVLGDMADKYGPIFYIRLGRKPTLIVSTWELAKECFDTNDKVFLDRPYMAAMSHAYGGAMFGLGQRFGQYWPNMRRITTHALLSNTRLDHFQNDRSSEVKTCVKHLFSLSNAGSTKIDMSEWVSLASMNIMTRMIVGKSFDPSRNDVEWRRFVKATEEFMNLMGTFVISDVIPCTEWMDVHGHFGAVGRAVKECDRFIVDWVEEHVRKRREGEVNTDDRDFLDIMLSSLENDPSLSYPHSAEASVKGTILSLINAGVETTASVIKWAFSLLINHPEVLKKVQDELDTHVGKIRWVEESDMKNLTYLIAVIKETMRLMVPLGVPRESTEDCTIAGYHIPKGTSLIVNLWKLHHDPRVYSDPDEFQPERFLSGNGATFNARDKNFMFIPFTAGRKSCPGMTSGMQMMSLIMGRVLQGFDLGSPDGKKVDMREGLGLTNPRATPLELVLTPRLSRDLY